MGWRASVRHLYGADIAPVHLAALRAMRVCQGVTMEEWRPEALCFHEYEYRPRGSGCRRRTAFKPDAYLRLRLDVGKVVHLFVEIDLGHTSSRQFAAKVATHQHYLGSGLFRSAYGTGVGATAVVTTGEKRLANLSAVAGDCGTDRLIFTTFAAIDGFGMLDASWFRTGMREPDPLLGILGSLCERSENDETLP